MNIKQLLFLVRCAKTKYQRRGNEVQEKHFAQVFMEHYISSREL